ncbi:hypothetical protein KR222_007640, partial [Zaprionus bogoriensis]
MRARLLSALRRRRREEEQVQQAGTALQFQTIVVVVDKASGAVDHQLCADADADADA